ncbi:MAG: malate synthase G, partial [Rhodospirillaceae bacterium]
MSQHPASKAIQIGNLQVAAELQAFVDRDVLPGTGIDPARFWSGLDALLHDLAPRNRALLATRDTLQAKIDAWHKERRGKPHDA